MDEYKGDSNTWFIGNHADELTPWIPLLARKAGCNFFVIPCCPFDFFGKCQKKSSTELHIKPNEQKHLSSFQNYIAYMNQVARKCGYQPVLDKLKIPSTKRICIIGSSQKLLPKSRVRKVEISDYLSSKLARAQKSDSKFSQSPGSLEFQSRNPQEKVNNCTKISRETTQTIVNKIFTKLLSEIHMVEDEGYVTKWNSGKHDLRLKDVMDFLTEEEKCVLKSQGNGIQTLIKNNKYIFTIEKGCVKLRQPALCTNSDIAAAHLRSKPCYFFRNHPNGCPLTSNSCAFRH